MASPTTITLAHSPDPDDAFMWWPLFEGLVVVDGLRFEQITADIEALNRRAAGPEEDLLDVTAMSCANAARVRDRYLVTGCGASVGDGYGPKLVSRSTRSLESLARGAARIGVPGARTTAALALNLLLGAGRFTPVELDFERIADAVVAGEVDAGVVIHEGQLTFESSGLVLIEDLGRWWRLRTGLPLPLGVNAVRRDLDERFGAGSLAALCDGLHRSVRYALDHRRESLERAMRFARGIDADIADRFVDLYVNRWTLELGDAGRFAVRRLVDEAVAAGLLERGSTVEFVPSPRGVSAQANAGR